MRRLRGGDWGVCLRVRKALDESRGGWVEELYIHDLDDFSVSCLLVFRVCSPARMARPSGRGRRVPSSLFAATVLLDSHRPRSISMVSARHACVSFPLYY